MRKAAKLCFNGEKKIKFLQKDVFLSSVLLTLNIFLIERAIDTKTLTTIMFHVKQYIFLQTLWIVQPIQHGFAGRELQIRAYVMM